MTDNPNPMVMVPREPTEAMWGTDGLARSIMMWLDYGPGAKTPRALFNHLERSGKSIPDWLRNEGEMKALDHVPSKATRCVLIYKAMVEDALSTSPTPATEEVARLIEQLRGLMAKSDDPNGHDWMHPWKVVPSDGKPIITSNRGGNLFRGYIATWDQANLIVEAVNALPTLLDMLAAFASGGEKADEVGSHFRNSGDFDPDQPANTADEREALVEALRAVRHAMLNGGDGAVGDFGWSMTKLNKARPLVRAALAALAAIGEGKE